MRLSAFHSLQSSTPSLLNNLSRASNLSEGNIWVIRSVPPVPSPGATLANDVWDDRALVLARNTTVSSAPSVSSSVVLGSTSVEDSDTSSWHGNVKVVGSQITAGVGGLDNHLLAGGWAGGEGELVAGAAPGGLGLAVDADGGETVGEVVVDYPWLLVGAHVGGAVAASSVVTGRLDLWNVRIIVFGR